MNLDEFVKLTEALTKLIGVLMGPVLLAVVLVKFGPSLKEFFSSSVAGASAENQSALKKLAELASLRLASRSAGRVKSAARRST